MEKVPKNKELVMNKANFDVCIDLCMYFSKMLYVKYNHTYRGICIQRCQLIKPVSEMRFIHPKINSGRPTARAIDPVSGVCFVKKILLINPSCSPVQYSLNSAKTGLTHLSFIIICVFIHLWIHYSWYILLLIQVHQAKKSIKRLRTLIRTSNQEDEIFRISS